MEIYGPSMNDLHSPSTGCNREQSSTNKVSNAQYFLPDSGRSRLPEYRRNGAGKGSYFEPRPFVAPSPTASLVADLSQNFHLGAS